MHNKMEHATTSRVSVPSKTVSHSVSRKSAPIGEDDVIETIITVPPDGGWGWVIVAVSFFCNFTVDGTMYSFGIYLSEIAESFDCHPSTVAVASSIMTGFYYCFGAVTCALVNRFGFRTIGFLGGLLACTAFVIASQLTQIVAFLLVLGIMGGTGFGMIYVPSIVAIGFYFERWRSLSTSLAVTGSAMGIVFFPLINDNLMHSLTWQIKFLVTASFLFFVGLLAVAYRPLKPVHVLKHDNQIVRMITEEDSIDSDASEEELTFCKRLCSCFRFHNRQYPTAAEVADNATLFNDYDFDYDASIYSSMQSSTILRNEVMDGGRSLLSTVYEDDNAKPSKKRCSPCCSRQRCFRWCGGGYTNRPMYRDDILFGGSLNMLPNYTRSLAGASTVTHTTKSTVMDYHMSVYRVATQRDITNKGGKGCPEAVARILATMLDFRLMKSPAFCLLAISGGLTFLGLYVPFIYSIERAVEFRIDRDQTPYLLSILGLANGLGRIINGVLSSIPGGNPIIVSYVNIFICGVCTIGSCFMRTLLLQMVYSAIFGFTCACIASLRPPIVVELFGIEHLTNAFGIILMFEGLAGFLGVPIAGALARIFDTYNACFYYSGISITLSAILLMPIKRLAEWEARKKQIRP